MNSIISFIKKEIVLIIATLLAIMSSFIIKPSSKYINYIDFRTLSLLFCLMIVIAGFKSVGVFDYLSKTILNKLKTTRQLSYILIFICFFLSMLITNDVALIIFVPLTIMILDMLDKNYLLIPIIILQTIAANLGSMLTPIGNPQNLYLFSYYNISLIDFILTMLPFTVLSGVLLALSICFIKNESITVNMENKIHSKSTNKLLVYIVLFILCILSVLHIIHYIVLLAIIITCIFIINKSLFKDVDYMLLLTFITFFIFIGNIGNIETVKNLLENIILNREFIVGVLSSQIVSNVPGALLLSSFTENGRDLLIGVNIGGLGTLIASMASLISYKLYTNTKSNNKFKYIIGFTILNVLFLGIFILFYYIVI